MIVILFNEPKYEYDLYSLVKAFYPDEEIQMYYTCSEEELAGRNVSCTHHELGSDSEEKLQQASLVLHVDYRENGASIGWKEETMEVDLTGLEGSEAKSAIKRALYRALVRETGEELPWGTLTGIRPTKIPMKKIEEGADDEEAARYMQETYLASDRKTKLAIEIAHRELDLLRTIDYERGYSLYIGIPFCPSTCLYCSFTSYPLSAWRSRVDDYLDALMKEIDYTAEACKGRKLNSVYIGGGTPTTLEPDQLERLITKVQSSFDMQYCVEFTVEAGRPDSITREKLAVLKRLGIDRISVNPQTMKQETLNIIGRHHTVEQTIESFHLAREVGIRNINMDLILGLPNETIEDVRHTMEVMKELGPDNITIHSLAVKRAARLNIYKDYYKDMSMVNTAEHMDLCEAYCREMGLSPYYLYRQKGMKGNMENVGYAKSGAAGVYNILIMEEKQTIMALGAGATTKLVLAEPNPQSNRQIERVENVKEVGAYISRIDEMIERKVRKTEELQWH